MKILMVNKFLYPRGGAETYFLKLGEQLNKEGHEVIYFGMSDPKNTVGNPEGLYTGNMDFHGTGAERFLYPFKIIYSMEAKRKFSEIIRWEQPDVIHFNNINFQLTPSVIDAGWEAGIPMVQTAHDSQMVCPGHLLLNTKTKRTCTKCINGSKWNCARYSCIHGSKVKSILGSVEGILYKYRKNYDRLDRIICPSSFMEKILKQDERFVGKTLVLPNFAEEKKMDAAAEKKGYVLYFGRLSEEKGLDGLLKACRMLPEIPFVIAGSGPMEEMCRNTGLKNVTFVGFQTGKQLETLIREAAFSLCLSICYENCPLSVLESQQYGTPVIGNRIGGIPELIEEGTTGLLNNEFIPESYARTIKGLYENHDLLWQMTENCRKRKFMGLKEYTEQMVEIYQQVIAEHVQKRREQS